MNAVVGPVRQLGVDETSFLRAKRRHHTIYPTGLVDLERRCVIDMVQGDAAVDLRKWTANDGPDWLAGIEVVATGLAQSFRAGLSPHLDHAVRVADPFHVVRIGNRCVEAFRRRVITRRSGTGDARTTRSTSFASCSSPDPNSSTNEAAIGCCCRCGPATQTTKSSAPGSRKRAFVTCTWPATTPMQRSCWTKQSAAAPPTRSPKSDRSAPPSRRSAQRS
jgi:hypothetical protein